MPRPSPQPYAQMQQQLAAHWQAFYAATSLRLGRWLVAAADRPLLHDYLLELSMQTPAAIWPAAPGSWPVRPPAEAAPSAVIWLTQLPAEAEYLLRQELTRGGTHRFIVLEASEQQPLRRLARWYPTIVQTTVPEVSMARLLREVQERHEQALPQTPDEHLLQQFRQQFRQLTEALACTDKAAVTALSAACHHTCQVALQQLANSTPLLALAAHRQAQELNWLSAEIGIWLALGPHYLVQRQPELALAQYQAALAKSEAAYAAGQAGLGLLSVHAWLGQASAWQQGRRYAPALAALQQALARAEELQVPMLGAEAARQLGLALDRAGQHRAAGAVYSHALDLSERLPPGQRHPPLVQEAGAACLKRLHTAVERKALRDRLQLLC